MTEEKRAVDLAAMACARRLSRDRGSLSSQAAMALDVLGELLLDSACSPRAIAQRLGRGGPEAVRALAAELGVSLRRYMTRLRLVGGLQMLAWTDLGIGRLSVLLGWERANSLGEACLRHYGLSPGELRLRLREELREKGGVDASRSLRLEFGRSELLGKGITHEQRELWARWLASDLAPWLLKSPRGREVLERGWLRSNHRALFDALLEQSRAESRIDAWRGVEAARLLVAFAEGSAELLGTEAAGICTLAWAWLGNAQRLARDFVAAEESFARAEVVWAERRSGFDAQIEGKLCYLKASLRLDQRRLGEARDLLGTAATLAQVAQDAELEVATLLQRAGAAICAREPCDALPDLRAAIQRLDAAGVTDSRHLPGALQSLAFIAIESGDVDEAEASYHRAVTLHEDIEDPASAIRLGWIKGLIAKARGSVWAAERALREARIGFVTMHDGAAAAIVSLDLSMLLLDVGRGDEIVEIVTTDIIPVLESLQMDRECLAALNFLNDAVEDNALSLEPLTKARAALRSHVGTH